MLYHEDDIHVCESKVNVNHVLAMHYRILVIFIASRRNDAIHDAWLNFELIVLVAVIVDGAAK